MAAVRAFACRRPRRKPEESIVLRADDLCAKAGCVSVHFSQARETNQTPGIPDRLYWHDRAGIGFWYEAKAPDGVQSWEQQEFERHARACHQLHVKGTLRDVFEFLLAHRLWRLPPGVPAEQVTGEPWKVRLETREQYERRLARAGHARRGAQATIPLSGVHR